GQLAPYRNVTAQLRAHAAAQQIVEPIDRVLSRHLWRFWVVRNAPVPRLAHTARGDGDTMTWRNVTHALQQRRAASDIAECEQLVDLVRVDLGAERGMRQKGLCL